MKGTRYTIVDLRKDIAQLNKELETYNDKYRLVIEQFNGLTWVSIATPDEVKRHCTTRCLIGGSPRECWHEALLYTYSQARLAK